MSYAATIVEYSNRKQAGNYYPDRIISPPAPSGCCTIGMEQVGDEEREGEWIFVYMRCRGCGYTVRRFMYNTAPSPDLFSQLLELASDSAEDQEYRWQRRPRGPLLAEEGEA